MSAPNSSNINHCKVCLNYFLLDKVHYTRTLMPNDDRIRFIHYLIPTAHKIIIKLGDVTEFFVPALAWIQRFSPAPALTGLCESTLCAFPLSILFSVHSQTHVGEPQDAVTSPGSIWVEREKGGKKKGQTQKQSTNPVCLSPAKHNRAKSSSI